MVQAPFILTVTQNTEVYIVWGKCRISKC